MISEHDPNRNARNKIIHNPTQDDAYEKPIASPQYDRLSLLIAFPTTSRIISCIYAGILLLFQNC